jgi:uncharacterized protein YndB with AHSA1/START domain
MHDSAATTCAATSARRVFQVVINAPIETVWKEITRTDAPIACFFNSQMHLGRAGLAPGSRLAMRTPNGKLTGVVGKILELDPPRRFSHTFKFTRLDDPECTVTYDLKPLKGGSATEFTLTIDNLPVGTKTAKQMEMGGKVITKTLKAVIETGRPTVDIRLFYMMFGVLTPLLPAKCRSENWPVN